MNIRPRLSGVCFFWDLAWLYQLGILVGVGVNVGGSGVLVGVLVGVDVGDSGVSVGVLVGVDVGGSGVFVGVFVGVAVGGRGVFVGVDVGVGVAVKLEPASIKQAASNLKVLRPLLMTITRTLTA